MVLFILNALYFIDIKMVNSNSCWNEILKLSEQKLVDCVNFCYGCAAGLCDKACIYVIDNQNG